MNDPLDIHCINPDDAYTSLAHVERLPTECEGHDVSSVSRSCLESSGPQRERVLCAEESGVDDLEVGRASPDVEIDPDSGCGASPDVEIPPDGGYGWVVVVSAFFLNMLSSGLLMSYGVYLPDLTQYFQRSQASMAAFLSVESIITCLAMLCASRMIRSHGDRSVGIIGVLIAGLGTLASAFCDGYVVFVLTFGVIRTFGLSLMMLCPNIVVQKYFRRRRALAAGISSMGLSGGVLCFSPLQRLLIDTFGWRGSLILFSAFVFQGLVLAALLRPLQSNRASKSLHKPKSRCIAGNVKRKMWPMLLCNRKELEDLETEKSRTYRKTSKALCESMKHTVPDRWVLLFVGSKCLTICGIIGMFRYAVSNAVQYGIDPMLASLLPALIGLASAVSRLMVGGLGMVPVLHNKRLLMYAVGNVLNGCVLIVASFGQESFLYHAVACSMFGLALGTHEGLATTVIADLFGIVRVARVASWVSGFPGLSLCLVLPLMGYLCDVTGTFRASMLLAGGIHTAGGFIFLTLLIPSHKVTSWDIQHGMIQEQKNMGHQP